MNYESIKSELADYNQVEVGIFIDYLKKLETDKDRQKQLRNKWFAYFKEAQAVGLYKKVALDELYIDGDTITIAFKGAVIISYNYQAYKNKLLNVYPESLFDVQLVNEGDTFSFRKESGKVIYSHELNNPFDEVKKIIGCYCIIKNNRGEFIETLNMTEVKKMKNVAKTQAIWNVWEGEMILKSVMKRACKRHFKDTIVNMEVLDNENYDLDTVNLMSEVQSEIEDCKSLEELNEVYAKYKDNSGDEVQFLSLLGEKKVELKQTVDENS